MRKQKNGQKDLLRLRHADSQRSLHRRKNRGKRLGVDQLQQRASVKVIRLEQEPERGLRCQKCIAHRLEATIQQAKLQQADYVTTTLSISPHKDALFINTTGAKLAETYGVSWLYADFKKKGGYLQSIALSKEYQLYRQDFCGCVYSRMQREAEKQNTTGTASKET